MTFAYPELACIDAGDAPVLRVTGEDPNPSIAYFRWGKRIESVPDTLRGGVYVALLGRYQADESLDARSARALFVVRDRESTAKLLVVLPLFTYHAYNVAEVDGTLGHDEGRCLYSGAPWVSLHRPGGGIGGHPWDEVNVDVYDRSSPRQTYAHWDAKGIAWIERDGYAYDCCTDVELDEPSFDLSRYRAIASFGHHEYWTQTMRDRIDDFISRGGNVAFFGGNTCWFRAEHDRSGHRVRRAGRWIDDPEWRTTGVSYALGGGKWIGTRPATGYRVANASHWVFAGAGIADGETFGVEDRLIGYECDGAPRDADIQVLAEASIAGWPVHDGSGEVSEEARATMALRSNGGMVFTASTVDWARVLDGGDSTVAAITRNVLNRFLGGKSG